MINYLDLHQINSLLCSLERQGSNQFNVITISDFIISISAGAVSLSNPKKFLPKLSDYKEVEIELIEYINHLSRIINPLNDDRFKSFSWANYFSYSDRNNKIMSSSMAAYVPLQAVPVMIRDIYKISKLKVFF